jgi:GT2 family glycosyltransferase
MISSSILVLIVNYRTAALSLQAVKAILPEIRERGDTHILIVDNGSGDGSAMSIGRALAMTGVGDCVSLLAIDENHGFAAGNNAGLDHYRARTGQWPDYAWLLNPDTIAEPKALSDLVAFLEKRPDAGLAGGRCLRPDRTIRPSAFRFPTVLNEFTSTLDFGPLRSLLARHDIIMPIRDTPIRADWLSGSNLLIRGTVFDRIGMLDPAYFLYFEETDFCARAVAAGFEAWHVPASRIIHIGGRATGITEHRPAARRPRYWFASRARFLLRRYGILKTHLANILWLMSAPLGQLIARLRGRHRDATPHLWRDFLFHYYGRNGLMYDPRRLAA